MTNIQIVTKDTFEIIQSAINKAVNLVKPTYGPSSNKVIISKVLHKMVVDDGVQIARDIELEDPLEDAVWTQAKNTAIRTNDRVGDGTTGALIMLQAIINEVGKSSRRDGRKIEKELKKGLADVKEQLLAIAHPIKTLGELEKVARISFDDEAISKVIANAWFQLGKDGVLTVDRSGTMETFSDITDGIKLDRGYISPYMVTNPERMEAVIEKPYILITDYRLTEATDVLPVMNALIQKGITQLVLIAENIEGAALATLIVNKMQGKFNTTAICAPANGDSRSILLEDIALMTGAKVFSEKKGDKLETVTLANLGRAERFTAKSDMSVIVGPKGKKADIQTAISDLNSAISKETNERVRNDLRVRLARLSGKVAVIRAGAATEQEEKALRYKIDDAIHAVHSAFKGGVVPGAGTALASLETSSPILNAALKAPFRQLKENVGLEAHRELKKGEAINVVTGKVGKFIEVGVMDPVEVLIAGVESAVSIASLLITSSGMIVEKPKDVPNE